MDPTWPAGSSARAVQAGGSPALGRHAAFIDKQISDTTIADLTAYFTGLPRVDQLGAPRFATPATAPQGQKYHRRELRLRQLPSARAARSAARARRRAADVDFDFFAKRRLHAHRNLYGPRPADGQLLEGTRVPESVLRDIYKFIKDDLGLLARLVATMDGRRCGRCQHEVHE
jgi:hypothetical protein